MGRRGRVLTAAAIAAAAVAVLVLVVLLNDDPAGNEPVRGKGVGQVTAEGQPLAPRSPEVVVPAPPPTAPSGATSPEGDTPGETPGTPPPGDVGVLVGSAGGLYPGAVVELPLTLTNPHAFPVSVDRTTVTATGTPGCPGRMLRLDRPRGLSQRLSPGSSTPTALAVRMGKGAPDACQGVRFAVRVQVTVVRS